MHKYLGIADGKLGFFYRELRLPIFNMALCTRLIVAIDLYFEINI